MCVAEQDWAIVTTTIGAEPSPKSKVHVKGPVPPLYVAVNVLSSVTKTVLGETVNESSTSGNFGGETVTALLTLAVASLASVTMRSREKVSTVSNVWVNVAPIPSMIPSLPTSQAYV